MRAALPGAERRQGQQRQRQHDGEQRPDQRAVPLCALVAALLRVEAVILQAVARHRVGFQVGQPAVVQAVILGVVTPDPWRVLAQHRDQPVYHRLAFRAVVHVFDPLVQAVEFRVLVIGLVLAVVLQRAVRAVEQKQEILRVRIVGVPAEEKHLRVALANFFLETVPVGGAHLQLYADAAKLLAIPVKARGAAGAAAGGVKVEHQRLAAFCLASARIAGLEQEFFRRVDRLALRFAVHPVIDQRVEPLLAVAVAEYARRNRPLRRQAAAVGKYGDELLVVDGDADGLAQFARALRLLAALARTADHRVVPVEGEIKDAGGERGLQPYAALLHLRRQAGLAFDPHFHRLVEGVRTDGRLVVIALHEFVPVGNALFFPAEHHLVDKGRHFSRIGKQARFAIHRLALGGICFTTKIGIAREHHACVGVVLNQHVRTGAHRPPIQSQVFFGEPRLRVKPIRFHRHRRKKRQCQPIEELRVFSLDTDAVGIAVHHLHTADVRFAQVQPGGPARGRHQRAVGLLQRVAKFLQADDVVGHVPEDRRVDARMPQPLDLVNIIVGRQFARAGALEIADTKLVAQLSLRQLQVFRNECRVRLVTHTGLDADVVDAVGDAHRIGVGRQFAVGAVEIARLGQGLGSRRDQLIGALEVVVLERRFEYLRYQVPLIRSIGLRRVEVLGPFSKRAVEDVLAALGRRIGVVPRISATAQQER